MNFTSKVNDAGLPGVKIFGLGPADIEDAATRKALNDLWIEHGLLIFNGVEGTDFQINLSEVFGKCAIHHARESLVPGHDELINISYTPANANVVEIDGVQKGAWLPWHADLIYMDKINHGGILRPVQVPKRGGETGFIDRIAAYDRLPDDLKREIEGLSVFYQFDMAVEKSRFGNTWGVRQVRNSPAYDTLQARLHEYPRSVHPMVYVQQETGRKVLNVSPFFALGIKDRMNEEGDELLRRVLAYAADENYAYYHKWQPDDMVLWDNWRMLHRGAGVPADDERWMQRTTIFGDYGLGQLDRAGADGLVVVDY